MILYAPTSSFESVIEDDDITSEYQYKINYGTTKVKVHHKNDDTPEHRIVLPNSCSFTLTLDLPHNVLNKLDDYRLNYGPLEYEASGSIFKESYILSTRPPWDYVDYIVSSSYGASGSMAFVTQSNGDVFVLGDDDNLGTIQEEYFKIQVPFLVDASGSRIEADLEMTTKKIQGKTKDIFRYSVESTWLDNAVYPVIIDPSIILYQTSNIINMYNSHNHMIARASNGNLVMVHGERTTVRLRAIIADGSDFSNPTIVDVATGATTTDYQNIIRAADGRLVCIYRYRPAGQQRVFSKYSLDNGLTWEGEVQVDLLTGTSWPANGMQALKDQDGVIWVALQALNPYYIILINSTDNGVSWNNKGSGLRADGCSLCEMKAHRKIIVYGGNQTFSYGRISVWDIDANSWEIEEVGLDETGFPSHNRAIGSGIACDINSNVIIWQRISRSADSQWELWEHKIPSGSAFNSVTGSNITVNGSGLIYGAIRTDRNGIFHKYVNTNVVGEGDGFGIWHSEGTFVQPDNYQSIISGSFLGAGYRGQQVATYIDGEESIDEFHLGVLEFDPGGNWVLGYSNEQVRKVGPTIMNVIG